MFYKVGSGKTITSIAAVENLALREGRRRPVIIVCPASLVTNYEKEMHAAGVTGYRVMSFNRVHNMTRQQRLEQGRGAVLVVDEVQNVRNPLSKFLDSLLELARHSHKRLLLTGTPVMNRPEDIASSLALLDPRPETIRQLLKRTVEGEEGHREEPTFEERYGTDPLLVKTARDEARKLELLSKFKCTTLFYEPDASTRRESYPSVEEHTIRVPLTPQMMDQHFFFASQAPLGWRRDLESGRIKYAAWLTKMRQANSAHGDMPKIDEAVRRIAEAYRDNKKCIAFSFYGTTTWPLKNKLAVQGIEAKMYVGGLSAETKQGLVDDYNSGRIRVLLLSDAGKEGLDLKETSEVHIMEPQWNEDKVQQIIGRAVRFKSHVGLGHVTVYRYVAIMPPDYQQYWPPHRRTNQLFHVTADQALEDISKKKTAVNNRFLDAIIRIAKRNEMDCLSRSNYALVGAQVPSNRRAESEPPNSVARPRPRRTVSS